MKLTHAALCLGAIGLSACQNAPPPTTPVKKTQPTSYTTPEGVTIIPYDVEEIKRQKL